MQAVGETREYQQQYRDSERKPVGAERRVRPQGQGLKGKASRARPQGQGLKGGLLLEEFGRSLDKRRRRRSARTEQPLEDRTADRTPHP